MGSQQTKEEEQVTVEGIKHTTDYSLDFRLIQKFISVPSYFPNNTQKILEEIEQISKKIEGHPLENYLIHCIDLRFSKYNKLNMQAVKAGKQAIEVLFVDQSPFGNRNWFELETKERFLGILDLLKKQYEIQCLIQKQYLLISNQNSSQKAFDTLRRPLKGQATTVIDQGLIMRLFYHYYILIIKTYANSGQKHIFKFHEETGRQLCYMIFHGYLDLEELYELFYFMVFIDKHPHEIIKKLSIINRLYHSKCLKTFYTINVDKKYLQLLQTTSRLYLDQLYLNSIREAQDPEIRNTDDTLMPIKMFPISRVKDKPKT